MRRFLAAVALLTAMTSGLRAADFETATEAVANMRVGWNLGNTLDAHTGITSGTPTQWETCWGQPVTKPELMQMMSQAGFGAIRVPVTWYRHMDSSGKVDAAWMKRVHEVVDYVTGSGMYCILNVHHDTGTDGWLVADEANYNKNKSRFEYLWKQIAEEFRDYDEHLLFEAYNEMLDSKKSWCFASFASASKYDATIARSAYNAINSYAQSFVSTVRATGGNNAQRNLVVNTYAACSGSGSWNSHLTDPLAEMKLPADNVSHHIIFQVHSYLDVNNVSNVKREIDDMIGKLNKHLVAKGAPVIIGEWGTSNVDASVTDYDARRDNVLAFARYFVEQTKANGIGTFYWMGISNGATRSLPAFSQPDLAEVILQAWYGNDYHPVLLTEDDFEIVYVVEYNSQWAEMNLCNKELSPSAYKGIKVEFAEVPAAGNLQVKVYGAADDKGQYEPVPGTSATFTVNFNASALGNKVRRVTLQYNQTAAYKAKVRSVTLLKADGTEEKLTPSVFWGCQLSMESVAKPSGVTAIETANKGDGHIYNLNGQRVETPRRGIYIVNGRKVLVR